MFKKMHVFRVKPGQDLLSAIARYCSDKGVTSGILIGIIGSVTEIRLNFLKALPGKYVTESISGPMEIVSAQGSVALKDDDLIVHIHIQVSGQEWSIGGHLVEAEVFSTAEVVIGELDFQLQRYADAYTGLNELES